MYSLGWLDSKKFSVYTEKSQSKSLLSAGRDLEQSAWDNIFTNMVKQCNTTKNVLTWNEVKITSFWAYFCVSTLFFLIYFYQDTFRRPVKFQIICFLAITIFFFFKMQKSKCSLPHSLIVQIEKKVWSYLLSVWGYTSIPFNFV